MNYFESIFAILPILILTGTALIILLVEAFIDKHFKNLISLILSVAGLIFSMYYLICGMKTNATEYFGGSYIVDNMGMAFSLIISIVAILVIFVSFHYITKKYKNIGEYYSLILFASAGMISLSLSNDMMTFFISLEVMSIAVYVLAGLHRENLRSNESAVKYLILGAFASAFLLLGIAFIYGATGEMHFGKISKILLNHSSEYTVTLGSTGLLFILIGFLFKIGAVPFQQWVPDVYEGAPMSVTAFMATGVKTAAFAILIRGLITIFQVIETQTLVNILSIITVLTMIVGNFMALIQDNIKRLLAYSGIAHTGYILLGIIASKVTSPNNMDISPILFYLLAYALMNIGAFSVLIGGGSDGKDLETFDDIRGLGYKNRLLGLCMVVFFFSLAGIPSTAGFMGKFFIFKSAIQSQSLLLYGLSIIGILTAIVSVYYYLKIVVYLYLKEEKRVYERQSVKWNYLLINIISLVITLLIGIFPHIGYYILKI